MPSTSRIVALLVSRKLFNIESLANLLDPNQEHTFASVTANHTYPAVISEQSSYVGGIQCETDGISISFSSSDALLIAKQSWTQYSQFVLVTHTSGCGAAGVDAA